MLTSAEAHGVVIGQIEQSARRGDDDIRATSQRHHLRIDRDAAEHGEHLDGLRQISAEGAERLADLRRKLTRRHQITRPLTRRSLRYRGTQQPLQASASA